MPCAQRSPWQDGSTSISLNVISQKTNRPAAIVQFTSTPCVTRSKLAKNTSQSWRSRDLLSALQHCQAPSPLVVATALVQTMRAIPLTVNNSRHRVSDLLESATWAPPLWWQLMEIFLPARSVARISGRQANARFGSSENIPLGQLADDVVIIDVKWPANAWIQCQGHQTEQSRKALANTGLTSKSCMTTIEFSSSTATSRANLERKSIIKMISCERGKRPKCSDTKNDTRALCHSTDDGMAQFAGLTEDLTRPPREGLCLDLRYNLPRSIPSSFCGIIYNSPSNLRFQYLISSFQGSIQLLSGWLPASKILGG